MDKDWAEEAKQIYLKLLCIRIPKGTISIIEDIQTIEDALRKVRREAIESCAVIADETLVPTTAKLIRESEGKV